MKRWKPAKTIIYHGVLLLVVYFLSSVIIPYTRTFSLVPLLLPICAVGIALFEGGVRGGVFGLVAGMLCDLAFEQPLLMFTVMLTFICVTVGTLSETVLARGFPSYFLASLLSLAVASFVQMFGLLFFVGASAGVLIMTGVWQTLFTMVFTVPMYYAVKAVSKTAQS